MHKRLGELEHKRVSGIKGNIHLTAQDKILLPVVLVHPADGGGATKGITRIQRGPEAVIKGIANVSFNSG